MKTKIAINGYNILKNRPLAIQIKKNKKAFLEVLLIISMTFALNFHLVYLLIFGWYGKTTVTGSIQTQQIQYIILYWCHFFFFPLFLLNFIQASLWSTMLLTVFPSLYWHQSYMLCINQHCIHCFLSSFVLFWWVFLGTYVNFLLTIMPIRTGIDAKWSRNSCEEAIIRFKTGAERIH